MRRQKAQRAPMYLKDFRGCKQISVNGGSVQGTQKRQLGSRILVALAAQAQATLISDNARAWTGVEISSRIKDLVSLLDQMSHPGDYIGISYPNSAAKAILILATMVAGRVPVLISFTEFTRSPESWTKRARVSLLFTSESSATEGAFHIPLLVPLAIVNLDGVVKCLVPPSHHDHRNNTQNRSTESDGTALVLFTSGSTGTPKGVRVPESGLLQTADHLIRYFSLNESTVASIVLPICHSMALNTQFLPTLLAGGRSHFVQSDFGFHRTYRSILDQKANFVAMISMVLGICRQEKIRYDLPSATHVREVQLAGGTITARDLEVARQLFPNATLHKGYGLTEATRVTMISSLDPAFDSAAVGRPLPFLNVEIHGVDGDEPNAAKPGYVVVRGANVLQGYIDGSHVHSTSNGFFVTGDLGYWNEHGQLCIAGRSDDLMKVNGHRISAGEIERQALNASDKILAAKCIAVDDNDRNSHSQKIVLFVEVKNNDADESMRDNQEIQSLLWQAFRAERHRPSEILILDSMPRTANGKIALQELRTLSSDRSPDFTDRQSVFKNRVFPPDGSVYPERKPSMKLRSVIQASIALLSLVCVLPAMAKDKPFKRALVISGGGITPGVSLGIIAGVEKSGWKPDVIITTCGSSVAAAIRNSYATPQQAVQYALSPAFKTALNSLKVETSSVFAVQTKFDGSRTDNTIPQYFGQNVMYAPQVLRSGLPVTDFKSDSEIPRIIMVAAKTNFGPSDVGSSIRPSFTEVYFTDPQTATALEGLSSPIHRMFPSSHVESRSEVITTASTEQALRASIADPYLMSPGKIGGSYYMTGAVDLYPIDTALEVADEVVATYPASLFQEYEDFAIRRTFGFSQNESAVRAIQHTEVKWIDISGIEEVSFDPKPVLIRLVSRIPGELAEFKEKMKAQIDFGLARAREALRVQSDKFDVRSHLRKPISKALINGFTCGNAYEWKTASNANCSEDWWPGCDRKTATQCSPIR